MSVRLCVCVDCNIHIHIYCIPIIIIFKWTCFTWNLIKYLYLRLPRMSYTADDPFIIWQKKKKEKWMDICFIFQTQTILLFTEHRRKKKKKNIHELNYLLATMSTIIDIKWQIKIRTPYLNRIMNSISRTLLHSWNLRLIKFSIINAKLSVREVLFIRHNTQLKASWAES